MAFAVGVADPRVHWQLPQFHIVVDRHAGRLQLRLRLGHVGHSQRDRSGRQRGAEP